jgi:hypothetical protein
LVENVVTARDRASIEQTNAGHVVNAFYEKYGEDAEKQFVKLAKDLQVGVQFLNSMAKVSPAAVLKLAGFEKREGTLPTGSSGSSVNAAAFTPQPPEQKRKQVMTGASTKDLVNEWRRVAPKE